MRAPHVELRNFGRPSIPVHRRIVLGDHTNSRRSLRPRTFAARMRVSSVALLFLGSSRRSTCTRLLCIRAAISTLVTSAPSSRGQAALRPLVEKRRRNPWAARVTKVTEPIAGTANPPSHAKDQSSKLLETQALGRDELSGRLAVP